VGAGNAGLEGVIKTDGRRCFDFGDPGYRHGIPPFFIRLKVSYPTRENFATTSIER
jgi:hypothetical protein